MIIYLNVSGAILIDEMALDEGVSFDKATSEVNGFVNLGSQTTDDDETRLADHALVFLYQPFKGSWFQALGAFATKGAASGSVLERLIVEAIALCEQSGLFVDEITTDGGSWNRCMWGLFGINEMTPTACILWTHLGAYGSAPTSHIWEKPFGAGC